MAPMILVTGAAGFLGHHIVRALLEDGQKVAGLDIADMTDLPGIVRVTADITSQIDMTRVAGNLLERGIKAAIHLAAVASPPIAQRNPPLTWATNVYGTHNVLELLHKIACPRIVFFSSAHVYGISPKYMPTDEEHPLALHDVYTTTKILGEDLCRLYYENHGIAYTSLRLWNAYGEGQSKDYFLGAKISQAKAGRLTIRNENVTKDWVHASDVARATLLACKSDYVGPLNVGTGIETRLGDVIQTIAASFGLPVTREDVPDEGPTRMRCDNHRITATLGWTPQIRFEDGLQNLISSWKARS